MHLLEAIIVEVELRKQGETGRLGNLSLLELLALAEKLGASVNNL